jgi:cytochrome oxidase Cu insertion factor (SCO1/SenC/PrrC family)
MAYPTGDRRLHVMLFMRRLAATLSAVGVGVINTTMRERPIVADLHPGDPAPDFELTGSDHRTYRLNELKGQPVILAWFPKAFTGG